MLPGRRVRLIPPWVFRPVDWRPVASRRAAFEPEPALLVFPYPDGVAVEIFAAMQAPLFKIQVRPAAGEVVIAQEIQFLVEGEFYIIGHGFASVHSFRFGGVRLSA